MTLSRVSPVNVPKTLRFLNVQGPELNKARLGGMEDTLRDNLYDRGRYRHKNRNCVSELCLN